MGYLLGTAVLLIFLLGLYIFDICFYSPRNRREDPYALSRGEQYEPLAEVIQSAVRAVDHTPCRWIRIKSYDGLVLWGRYYHRDDNMPTMIVFHGYRSYALRDCAPAFAIGRQLGFNVLIPDQRAHGRSDGRIITFGIRERWDVLSWVHCINRSFRRKGPVILAGLSMGAATVLMASDLPLPDNVCCILADCPYDSPAGIIRKVCRDMKIPPKLAYPFIRWTARICGFSLECTSASKAVQKARVPIALFHGEDDRYVPCTMSRSLSSLCAGPVKLCTFPDAGHGLCYITDPMGYEKAVFQFLAEIPEVKSCLSL